MRLTAKSFGYWLIHPHIYTPPTYNMWWVIARMRCNSHIRHCLMVNNNYASFSRLKRAHEFTTHHKTQAEAGHQQRQRKKLHAWLKAHDAALRAVSGFVWIFLVLFTFSSVRFECRCLRTHTHTCTECSGSCRRSIVNGHVAASASKQAHTQRTMYSTCMYIHMYVCVYACTHGWMRAERDVAPLCYCAAGALFYAASSKLWKVPLFLLLLPLSSIR